MKRIYAPAIFLLAISIRIAAGLLPNCGGDEAFSYFFSRLGLGDLFHALRFDHNPPLYYFILHFFSGWSHSEIILRSPAILASIFSVYFVYKIAGIVTGDDAASLLAALFAAAFFSLWHSDAAIRMYPVGQAFELAATYFWVKIILKKESGPASFAGYVPCMALSVYCHYLCGVFLAAHALCLLMLDRSSVKGWLSLALAAAAISPLFLLMRLQGGLGEATSFHLAGLSFSFLYLFFLGVAPFLQTLFHPDWTGTILSSGLQVVSLLLLGWQILVLFQHGKKNSAAAAIMGIIPATYLVFLFAGALVFHTFGLHERYFYLLYPYLAIVLATGTARVESAAMRNGIAGILIALNLFLFYNYDTGSYLWNCDMKPLADQVIRESRGKTALTFYLSDSPILAFHFYFSPDSRYVLQNGELRFLFSAERGIPEYVIPSVEDLRRKIPLIEKFQSTWLVMNREPFVLYAGKAGVIRLDRQAEVVAAFRRAFKTDLAMAAPISIPLDSGLPYYEEAYYLFHFTPR